MSKKPVWGGIAILFVLAIASLIFAQTPTQDARWKTARQLFECLLYIPKADVEKVQTAIRNGSPNDSPVRMVNIGGKYNPRRIHPQLCRTQQTVPPEPRSTVGITGTSPSFSICLASGAGIWRVGGELENPADIDVNGPLSQGSKRSRRSRRCERLYRSEVFHGDIFDRSARRAA